MKRSTEADFIFVAAIFSAKELEVSCILPQLPQLIATFSSSPIYARWGAKRKRSALDSNPPPLSLLSGSSPPTATKKIVALSPATPLAFLASESAENPKSVKRKLSVIKRKQKRVGLIDGLTPRRNLLRGVSFYENADTIPTASLHTKIPSTHLFTTSETSVSIPSPSSLAPLTSTLPTPASPLTYRRSSGFQGAQFQALMDAIKEIRTSQAKFEMMEMRINNRLDLLADKVDHATQYVKDFVEWNFEKFKSDLSRNQADFTWSVVNQLTRLERQIAKSSKAVPAEAIPTENISAEEVPTEERPLVFSRIPVLFSRIQSISISDAFLVDPNQVSVTAPTISYPSDSEDDLE